MVNLLLNEEVTVNEPSGAVMNDTNTSGSKPTAEVVMESVDLRVNYGDFLAVRDVNLRIHRGEITALIGSSGCGKSSIIRCFNRMNDLIPTTRCCHC